MVKCPICGEEVSYADYMRHYDSHGEDKTPITYKPKPEDRYRAFEALNDPLLLEQIKLKLVFWDKIFKEAVRTEYKVWSAQELLDLTDAFGKFNSSLQFGLPNELFDLFNDQISMSIFRPRKYWEEK